MPKVDIRPTSQVIDTTPDGLALQTIASAAPSSTDKSFAQKDVSPIPRSAGNVLVVPQGSILPNCCVKCGNTPTEPRLRLRFSWHHPGYYVLLITPLIYVIVALIVSKGMKLSVPLCENHKSIRRRRLWTGSLLLALCIPLPIAFATYINGDWVEAFAGWLGIAMFVVGLLFLVSARPLRVTRITSTAGEFTGACEELLNSVDLPRLDQIDHKSQPAEMGRSWSVALYLVGAVILILIIAAIAIPNLLRARIAANESSAVASLRTINTAEISYASAFPTLGYAPVLNALGGVNCTIPNANSACLIDTELASGERSGYRLEIRNVTHSEIKGNRYQAVAYPLVFNQTGIRTFCSDETGVIKFVNNGSADDCLSVGTPLE